MNLSRDRTSKGPSKTRQFLSLEHYYSLYQPASFFQKCCQWFFPNLWSKYAISPFILLSKTESKSSSTLLINTLILSEIRVINMQVDLITFLLINTITIILW